MAGTHHETRKKQHVVLCGHEATVSNPHRTFVAPVSRISEGRNKKSHPRRAPRDAERFTLQRLPRPSTATPANPHLPVQARERTARNRLNATSVLITPYQGEGSTRPFIFAHSSFTRAQGGIASTRLARIAHYPYPLLCTCDISQENASARAPRFQPLR